jgi:inner membrane protease subunit 1
MMKIDGMIHHKQIASRSIWSNSNKKFCTEQKSNHKQKPNSQQQTILKTFLQSLAAAYIFREHVGELTVCVGPSMMPTFNPQGDIALVEHVSKKVSVGDVVIAYSMQSPRQVVCKRVLGVEGDRVEYMDRNSGVDNVVVVPKGHVWLQGDNLGNSTDSRQYGPVPYAMIKGRVLCRLYPDFKFV